MLEEKPLRKLDVLVGAGLAGLSFALVARALRMPIGGTYGGVDNPWYASPAAMPLLLGALLLGCAVVIIVQAAKRGGHRALPPFLREFWHGSVLTRETARTALVWGGLLLYSLMLKFQPFAPLAAPLDRAGSPPLFADPSGVNYVLCSFLFLTVFIVVFHRPNGRLPRPAQLSALIAGSLVVALLVAWVFSELLRVPLP